MGKLRVFEAFSGYGSQSIALRNLGIDYEVVGISEIDSDALISYSAIRDLDKLNIDIAKTIEEMKEELMAKNVGYDFKKQKSSINREKSKDFCKRLCTEHRLIFLYSNLFAVHLISAKRGSAAAGGARGREPAADHHPSRHSAEAARCRPLPHCLPLPIVCAP
jgi:hypothetical protein